MSFSGVSGSDHSSLTRLLELRSWMVFQGRDDQTIMSLLRNFHPFRPGLTFDEYQRTKEFIALDGIRALAVTLVLTIHFGGPRWKWASGWLGVDVFFVLSGFLITTLLLREEASNARVSLRNFYVRRVFRIIPVYAVLLAILGLQSYFIGFLYWSDFKQTLPYYLTFMNDLKYGDWGPTWTLGIEWKFYMIWPLLLFSIRMPTLLRFLIAVVCLYIMNTYWHKSWLNPYHYSVLLIGACVAIAMHSRPSFELLRPLTTPSMAFVASVAMIGAHVFSLPLIKLVGGDANMGMLYGLIFVPFLISTLVDGPTKWVFSRPALVFIGKRSYSIYLVQVLAFQAVSGIIPGLPEGGLSLLTTLGIAIVFSDVLYRWVEQPMIKAGRLFSKRGKADALKDMRLPSLPLVNSEPEAQAS